ncbi:MAG TPA: NADH-quinone oxidoreductase subunit L [Vicinamibacteria bacterium]|nr:NADH-quinone oxidoreductase subunit L [Vicinamibacteria bacterium]
MFEDPVLNVLPFAVLLLPLGGFIVLALFGDWIKKDEEEQGACWLACATVVSAFALAVFTTVRLYGLASGAEGLRFSQPYLGFEWIAVGSFRVPINLLIDPLSSVMMLVVSGISAVIHVYSVGYMAHDEDKVRFFSYMNLFVFFMLLLVMGGSLPLLFVGWEGVGLCSYLLIGFWYRKDSASAAGLKAFVVNRIGDAGLILGMIFIFHAFGSLDLVDIADNAGALAPEALWQWGPVTIACLLLFLGAIGKSAQIPLHVWLPDAMEGPTPVSALIHAATMVTAGVYLVARLGPLFHQSETAMLVVAVTGAVTALMAGTIAIVQTDIKRVLAYSTVSQLGFMFLAAGMGAFGVAVFHLYTHAFFKALLFLGSGSVIHAMSGEQDMRRMGGLRKKVPWTYVTFLIGTLAIAGIPPLAGFFSKDEILLSALHNPTLFGIALFTALLTAAYMARLLFLTFFGEFRGGHDAEHHLHESPWSMLVPLVLLALGSIGAGFLKVPHVVQSVFRLPEPHLPHVAWLPAVATLTGVVGILIAWYLYLAMPELRGSLAQPLRPALRVFAAKYFFDHVYDGFVRHVVIGGSDRLLWKRVDEGVIDGAVNGAGSLTRAFAETLRPVQTGFVRHYVLLVLAGAVAVVYYLLASAERLAP